jgi:hypothetical protein
MLTAQKLLQKCKSKSEVLNEIEKLKNNKYQIAISNSLCSEWIGILLKMLVYDYRKRLTFSEVKEYFSSVEGKIKTHKGKIEDEESSTSSSTYGSSFSPYPRPFPLMNGS